MERVGPTFLGIGAQKAGTSWLYRQLQRHPEVWMPPVKELHYFDRSPDYPSPNNLATSSPVDRLRGREAWERSRMRTETNILAARLLRGRLAEAGWWRRWVFGHYDDDWYVRLFSGARHFPARGEFTPSYAILGAEDIGRIKRLNPELKLLFLVRDPIERAWSAVRFVVKQGYAQTDLDASDEIITMLSQPWAEQRADYLSTLDRYLTHFDPDQILIGFFDAIAADPTGLMSGVTDFLGIASFQPDEIDSTTRVNASPRHDMPDPVERYLLDRYVPLLDGLAERLGSYAERWAAAAKGVEGGSEWPPVSTRSLAPVVHPPAS